MLLCGVSCCLLVAFRLVRVWFVCLCLYALFRCWRWLRFVVCLFLAGCYVLAVDVGCRVLFGACRVICGVGCSLCVVSCTRRFVVCRCVLSFVSDWLWLVFDLCWALVCVESCRVLFCICM